MPGTVFLFGLLVSSALFVPPNTMEWNDDICRYRGTFDAARLQPEILQNTISLVIQGPALFWETAAKNFEVHADYAVFKEKYTGYAQYTQAINQQKLAYQNSGDPTELKKPLLNRPARPLCNRFVDILSENDLRKKLTSFLKVYVEVCREQGGLRRDCEQTARVHVQNWTSVQKANQNLVSTDWNNCMIHYDEVHQLPRPELASLFQSIEPYDCDD